MNNLHQVVRPTFPASPSPFDSVIRRSENIATDGQTGPIYMNTGPNYCRHFFQKIPQPITIGGFYRKKATEEIRITLGRGELTVAHLSEVSGAILCPPKTFVVDHTAVITLPPFTPYRLFVGSGMSVEIIASLSHKDLLEDEVPFDFPEQFYE